MGWDGMGCERASILHCEPTGRANARPMTGSAKQSILSLRREMDCFAALAMTALQTSGKPAGNKNPEGNRHADPASSQRLPLAADPVAAGRACGALRDRALSAQRADAAGAARTRGGA